MVVVFDPFALLVSVMLPVTLAPPLDVAELPDEPDSLDVGALVIERLEPSA